MTAAQRLAVRSLLVALMPDKVLHGGCVGADDDFDEIASEFQLPIGVYPSTVYSKWGKRRSPTVQSPQSPLVRNKLMAYSCNVLIATPKEYNEVIRSGTWATVRYARKYHKRIYLVFPDGSIKEEL